MRDVVLIDLKVHRLRATERAVLVKPDGIDDEVWLPLSQIEMTPPDGDGLCGLAIPEWMALQKGLI